jgi:rhamnosyltransferase
MGKAHPVRSPLRHYYLFRNALLLYRMRGISLKWKIADALQGVLRFGFYALFAKPRALQIRMMLLGLCHGLIGRTGPFVS